MWHEMWGWNSMWFGWIFWLAIIGLIIWSVKAFVSSNSSQDTNSLQETAMEILKKRYALSEISDEEFEEKKLRLQD